MRALRPGWVRRWPTGYLGPQGQVILSHPGMQGWMVITQYRGVGVTGYASNLEAAQVQGERQYASMRDKTPPPAG